MKPSRTGLLVLMFALGACSGEIASPSSEPRAPASNAKPPAAAPSVDPPESTVSLENAMKHCDASRSGLPQLRRLTLRQLENTLRDVFPQAERGWDGFTLNDVSSKVGFSNDATTLVVSAQTAAAVLSAAEQLATFVTEEPRLSQLLPCAARADAACAREGIASYGKRLFRRPLTAAEVTRYSELFDSVAPASSFANAVKWTLVALMQSPHSLYRRELGDLQSEPSRLDGYELATELAYTFGDSTPDLRLLDLAQAGKLEDAEVRLEQARRLLETPRGREGLRQFFREWLRYENVGTADRPGISGFAALRPALIEETRRYLDEVLYTDRGGVRELLASPFTFADATLAEYYGYASRPNGFERIPRDAAAGTGLLAQGSLLASAANAGASSPTQRGLLVREKLLCRTRPKPPANVPPLSSADPATYKTTRQHYEQAHAQGFCMSCHVQFDPIGFGFEHFDEGGRYRADEHGEPIDATGKLFKQDGADAFSFDGLSELAQGLAGSAEVVDCVSGLLVTYAFGGAAGGSCLAERAREGLRAGDYGLVELLARLTAEPHFRERSLELAAMSGTTSPADPVVPSDPPDAGSDTAEDATTPDAATTTAPSQPAPTTREDIGVTAQYQANNSAANDNVIGPFLQITNARGTAPIALDSLRVRYYFTNEHADMCPDGCRVEGYYAGIHPTGLGVTANRRYVAGDAKHAYLEITFVPGSPSLQSGQSVEVQQYFHTNPYLEFDETDDYSFDATFSAFKDSPKITVYRADALVWGEPP